MHELLEQLLVADAVRPPDLTAQRIGLERLVGAREQDLEQARLERRQPHRPRPRDADRVRLITVGQEFVKDGEAVQAVPEPLAGAGAGAAG